MNNSTMEKQQLIDTPGLSEQEQLNFFDRVLAASLQAEANAGALEYTLELAGTVIRLVFAGDALVAPLSTALAHLETVPTQSPAFTFHIWDGESTGVAIPPPPFRIKSYTDRGDIWGMNSPRIRCAFHWVEFSLNLMDVERGIGVYCLDSVAQLPYWCYASPLRTLFHWSMVHKGCQLLHAAAVGDANGAVLITGRGGLGKSTTALQSLSQGLLYLGDDYVVLSLTPEPQVHSLYASAKLDAGQLGRFKHFEALLINREYLADEKASLQLWPRYQDLIVRSLPLKAVVTPCFSTDSATTFGPVEKLKLQRAASFTTLSHLPCAGRDTYAFIETLVNRLPGLELILGQDLELVPPAISRLLALSPEEIRTLAATATDTAPASCPLVSVIIPVYNGASFLAETVANILSQNYPSLEIIVVDDGSTDDIAEVVAKLPLEVRFFRQPNAGPAAARNRGIKDASGEFITFQDVDDLWPPNNLRFLAGTLDANPQLDLVYGYAQLMVYNEANHAFEFVGNPKESFPYSVASGLYRRQVFERIGLFDADLIYGEDTDWFTRAMEAGLALERLEAVTLYVRRHGANMTAGKSQLELNALRVFKKALDRKRLAESRLG